MSGHLTAERNVRRGEVVTTDGTATTIKTIPIPLGKTMRIFSTVTAKRIAGSSGSSGDSASYTIDGTYKNVAGTVSLIGSLETTAQEDQVGWTSTHTISGITVLVRGTGATSNTVKWISTSDVQELS